MIPSTIRFPLQAAEAPPDRWQGQESKGIKRLASRNGMLVSTEHRI